MVTPPHTLTRRRGELRLPLVWPHLLAAFALLAALIVGTPLLAMGIGQPADALPEGSVGVAGLAPGERPSPLDRTVGELPDLLAAEVELGDNPTDSIVEDTRVDALGNPVAPTPTAQPKRIDLPVRRADALAPVDARLTRQGRFGAIPGPGPDGATPLSTYRRQTVRSPGSRPVGIIVGGLGINATLTRRAIDELPPSVTLSFAAHADDLQTWIDRARDAGHEVLLELPMESAGFNPNEPGAARALRVEASVDENRDNLHKLLARAQGYAGVINYNGDRVLPRSDVVAPLLGELSDSGLGFFADGSFTTPSLSALATSTKLPHAVAFGLIDPTADRTVIDARLSELLSTSGGERPAIGVGFAYPQTIDALKGWAATLSGEGYALVPATAALR